MRMGKSFVCQPAPTARPLLLAALVAATALAHAATPTPSTFHFSSGIAIQTNQSVHQLALPLTVYQGVTRDDLGDLRVFNGSGEAVPYSLLRQTVAVPAANKEVTLPLLNADVAKPGGAPASGLVIDTSRLPPSGATRRYTLRLETVSARPGFYGYTLDASDNQRQWRRVRDNAQLAIVEQDGQRIRRDSVSWDDRGTKYLRLRWSAPQQAPRISAALLSYAEAAPSAAPLLWSAPVQAVQTGLDHDDFALSGRMPLERLRINLPAGNTVMPVAIQQYQEDSPRSRRDGHWDTLASSVVYRLASPQGEVVSPDIALGLPATSRVRLALPARQGNYASPTLQVGFLPQVLLFQARGAGPFSLAWGAPGVASAAVAPATVLPNYRSDRKLDAAAAQLLPPVAPLPLAPPPSGPAPLSKDTLQTMVLAGLLLAAMAALLFKQRPHKGGPPA